MQLSRQVLTTDPPIIVSFRLQNGQCTSGTCDEPPAVDIELHLEPSFHVPVDSMQGHVLGAGVPLTWITKKVEETVSVASALNRLSFDIMPNAPIYPGSVITFRGILGTRTTTCLPCTGKGDLVGGLGCSDLCKSCVGNCLVVLNSTLMPHQVNLPILQSD